MIEAPEDDGEQAPRAAATPEEARVAPDHDTLNEPLSPLDALDERFALRPMKFGRDAAGMPTHLVDEQRFVPALSVESLVCLADCSKFVTRDEWGEVTAEFEPKDVTRTASGRYRVPMEILEARQPRTRALPGRDTSRPKFVEVEPVRPQCVHYMAQMTDSNIVGAKRELWRLCSARRDTAGALMDIGNMRLSACTLRSPRHLPSEATLDKMDAEKIEAGAHREYLTMLGGRTSGEAAGGLFGATDVGPVTGVVYAEGEGPPAPPVETRSAAEIKKLERSPYFAPPLVVQDDVPPPVEDTPPCSLADLCSQVPLGAPHYYLKVERIQPPGDADEVLAPVTELEFQQRFGAGEFRLQMFGPDPTGRRVATSGGLRVCPLTDPLEYHVPTAAKE